MSSAVTTMPRRLPPSVPAPPLPSSGPSPSRKRWNVDEFHELAVLPIFENRKMILVEGEVLDMPMANHPHDMGVGACQDMLETNFPKGGYWVRIQMALPLGRNTDPGPDVVVVTGSRSSHLRQPTSALLVIEVSDSTIEYDTGDKANLYAAGGIADYWVLDLNGRRLIVFRDPIVDAAAPFGFRYQTRSELDVSKTIAPLALSSATIRVADLLP